MSEPLPIIDLAPLFEEDEQTVLMRLLDPFSSDPDPEKRFNTAEGSFLYDFNILQALEFARLYDRLNVVQQAALLVGAAGDFLDLKGVELDIPRNQALHASVVLTVSGEDGTDVPQGSVFGTTSATDDDESAVEFATNYAVTIPSSGEVDVLATASLPGTGGNVGSARVRMPLTSIGGLYFVTNQRPAVGGRDVEDDDSYRGRLLAAAQAGAGSGNVYDYTLWAQQVPGVDDVVVFPLWQGPGTVQVVVFGPGRSVPPTATVTAAQRLLDPSVVNVALCERDEPWVGGLLDEGWRHEGSASVRIEVTTPATTEGASLATDLSLRGDSQDYFTAALYVDDVDNVDEARVTLTDFSGRHAVYTFPALSNGPQGVTWQVADMVVDTGFVWERVASVAVAVTAGSTAPAGVNFDAFRFYDHDGGKGQGRAPIGAQVTVSQPRALPITVTAHLVPREGYSAALVRTNVVAGLEGFFSGFAGSVIYLTDIENVIHDATGVLTFSGVTLNGFSSDLVLDPVELPTFLTFTTT